MRTERRTLGYWRENKQSPDRTKHLAQTTETTFASSTEDCAASTKTNSHHWNTVRTEHRTNTKPRVPKPIVTRLDQAADAEH